MKSIIIDGIEYDLVPKKKTDDVTYHKLQAVTYPEVEFIVSDDAMTWDKAVKWCKELGGKFPTMDELHAYRNQLSKHLGEKADNYFWSASTRSDSTANAWYVNLGNGFTTNSNKTSSCSVVCVR